MIKNYFQTFCRQLIRNRTYSLLNIIGLATGLTCFALIALWVTDEASYDKFNANYNRIFRLVSRTITSTGTERAATSSAPMARVLKDDYPEMENTVRLKMREEIVIHNNQQVLQPGILLTDPSFFDVFSYSLIRGNAATALNEPYSIILTEATAKKYFGDKDPLGKTLLLNMYDTTGDAVAYTVTGIAADPPRNAHFTYTMLASFKTIEIARPEVLTRKGWEDAGYYTYILLKKDADDKALSGKIEQFYGKYIGDLNNSWRHNRFYQLQPLRDIHLRSHLQHEIAPPGDIMQVYIFSTIGFFILLLAGINYTNLATARSAGRAKEVGIKKVAGAGKQQLILQYLSESVFTAIIALLLSFILTVLLQPFFYELTGKNLSLFSYPLLVLFMLGVTVFLGLLSGIYPALVLSSFKSAIILKGSFQSGNKGVLLRKSLVMVQFFITIVLITSVVIINSQMSFIRHKDLGYDKDALLFIRIDGNAEVIKGYQAFKTELERNPLIVATTTSNSMITGGLIDGNMETADAQGNPLQLSMASLHVDTGYFGVYGIRLLAGSNFSAGASSDTIRQVILNETAVKKIGWKNKEDAIGKPFSLEGARGIVAGIVNDFHFNSLEQVIEPLAISASETGFSRITLKIDMKQADKAIALIKNTWKKHFPAALFDYDFVSQQVKEQYTSEERFSKIFLYFSVLSLIIACLGLYGLISFTVFRKTKEIGVRKVLGATAGGIVKMLLSHLVKLLLLACMAAIPAAWIIMNRWLQDFAYRISPSIWMFITGSILVLLMAMLTTGIQSLRAALANPVKNLRTE